MLLFFQNAHVHQGGHTLYIYTHTHTWSLSADTGQNQANQPAVWCSEKSALLPLANPAALWDIWAESEGEEKGKGREGGRAPKVAIGKVYVTHRQEPERQTLAEDVTGSLSTVSGLCQLSVTVSLSFSLFTYPLTSIIQMPSLCTVCPCYFQKPCYDQSPAATITNNPINMKTGGK